MYHSVAQSINDDTATTLAFDSERYDPAGMHDPVTNNSRITIGTAGKYLVWAAIEFAAGATLWRQLYFLVNGTTVIAVSSGMTVGAGLSYRDTLSCEYDFAAGDYIEVVVRHKDGAALNLNAVANYSPEFGARRVA